MVHPRPIIFFDGECGLCSRLVRWTLARDKRAVFRFAPLQGTTASELLAPNLRADFSTIIVRESSGEILVRSAAVFAILSRLSLPWSWVAAAKILPTVVTDSAYRFVARYRKTVWAMSDVCEVSADKEGRFLQ